MISFHVNINVELHFGIGVDVKTNINESNL